MERGRDFIAYNHMLKCNQTVDFELLKKVQHSDQLNKLKMYLNLSVGTELSPQYHSPFYKKFSMKATVYLIENGKVFDL